MIRYTLNCEQGHSFESWFQNSVAYDKQAKRGLVNCPVCGSAKVEKAIMLPQMRRLRRRCRHGRLRRLRYPCRFLPLAKRRSR
jgi:hypothetical protein